MKVRVAVMMTMEYDPTQLQRIGYSSPEFVVSQAMSELDIDGTSIFPSEGSDAAINLSAVKWRITQDSVRGKLDAEVSPWTNR